ncbi:MAG: hypothetical protein ACK54C_15840 [Betaproteobacteria bacterium]
MKQAKPWWRHVVIPLALAWAGALLGGCATTQIEAQWRDPQLTPRALQGKTILVLCRGPDLTLERICEDKLAAQAQAVGIKVARRAPPVAGQNRADTLRQAALEAGADVVLATTLEPAAAEYAGGSGGSVGVGVGGSSGGWGSRSGAGIGISLPVGGGAGPGLGASTSVTDAATGKLLWSGRARSPRTASDAVQVGELSRVTVEALKATGLL